MKKLIFSLLISIFVLNLFCQVHWTKHSDNPVMVPGETGEWDESFIAPQSIIIHDSTYHMWYWGGILYESERIGHATSPDGMQWTKDPNNPVLDVGMIGSWDDHVLHGCSVILIDSLFHMWYTGHTGEDLMANWRIGHASSADGVNWIKDTANPVKDLYPDGPLSNHWSVVVSVLNVDDLYHMWYLTGDWGGIKTAHATSTDGINWTKDPQNPVLSPETNTWELNETATSTVIFDGARFHLWYDAHEHWEWRIGYATSLDGSSWDKSYHYNPVLIPSEFGKWDDKSVGFNVVIDSAGVKYKTWYCGSRGGQAGSIGYAESSPFVEIPDTAFLYALIRERVDTNGDSLISYTEAEAVTNLEVMGNPFSGNGIITDMTGIEAFVNLDTLRCRENHFTSLDVSNCTALTYLDCDYCEKLSSLDVSGCIALLELHCSECNQLNSLDISENSALEELSIGIFNGSIKPPERGSLSTLDLSNNSALENLYCSYQQLSELDLSNCTALKRLGCSDNYLSSLDLSNCTALKRLNCSGNYISTLDVSDNIALEELICNNYVWRSGTVGTLKTLDVSNCTALTNLECFSNQISTLDVSNCTVLTVLDCGGNQLSSLDLCNSTSIKYLGIQDMPSLDSVSVLPLFPSGVQVDTSNSPNVEFFDCSSTSIEEASRTGILIYPNPTNDFLIIETEYSGHYSIEIFSLNGQQILTGELEGKTHQINLSNFSSGVYFITIRSKDFVVIEKVIKL